MFTNKKREGINTFVSALSLYAKLKKKKTKKALSLNQGLRTPLPVIPFGIVAHAFVVQPFLKQLYTQCNSVISTAFSEGNH